ncbi:MAG: hypothetical protein FWD73_02180 [Polyangiaceae bacterium]|nr:hypothetical protein [Polyangiaceae bacterium]
MGNRTRFDKLLLAGSALAAAAYAAHGARSVAPASHDEAVIRVVGLGYTGPFRALDTFVSSIAMLLPVGTRALRAGLASAVVTGLATAASCEVARAAVAKVTQGSSKLGSSVAAAMVLATTLGSTWQTEGSAPGGSVVGALLVLLALATNMSMRHAHVSPAKDDPRDHVHHTQFMALLLGLSASYEPLVFASVAAACAPWIARFDRRAIVRVLVTFALGLAPLGFGFALSRRDPEMSLLPSAFGGALPEHGTSSGPSAREAFASLVSSEASTVLVIAAAIGVVIAASSPLARRSLISLVSVIVVGLLCVLVAPSSAHTLAPVLAALVAVNVLAAIALASGVMYIARARIPFARTSGALAVLLVLVLPARAADESAARRKARMPRAEATWNELVWGPLAPSSVLLVSDSCTLRRLTASRATGELRPDLLVVPTTNVRSRRASHALAAEPKLTPLYRNLALGLFPDERSLSEIASSRPLLLTFDPRWDRALARHLVPVGLISRFEIEPRAAIDRSRALDKLRPSRERLVHLTEHNADLTAATASLLRVRAIAVAACAEREVLSLALEDLRPFSPNDAVANTLVRRMVTSKGPIEVRDLAR